MKNEKVTPQQKIVAWFNNPDTPCDAWVELTIDELAKVCDVSTSSIFKHLPIIVKGRHPEVEDYLEFRKKRQDYARSQYKKGERLPDEDIENIQRLRKTHTIHEVAAITGFSPGAVQRYSQKYPK